MVRCPNLNPGLKPIFPLPQNPAGFLGTKKVWPLSGTGILIVRLCRMRNDGLLLFYLLLLRDGRTYYAATVRNGCGFGRINPAIQKAVDNIAPQQQTADASGFINHRKRRVG